MTTIESGLGTGQFKIGLSSDRKSFYLTTGRMTDQGQYSTADLLAALGAVSDKEHDDTMEALGEAAIQRQRIANDRDQWKARADKAEAKLADAERTLTELAPARDERVIAWEAIAKHEAFQPCYDEGRPLLNAVVDRIGALLDAEAERDAHAATIERVREIAESSYNSSWLALKGIRAALDPKPAFVLPTEAGARFEATDNLGHEVTFRAVWSGPHIMYLNESTSVIWNCDNLLAGCTDFRLLGADE